MSNTRAANAITILIPRSHSLILFMFMSLVVYSSTRFYELSLVRNTNNLQTWQTKNILGQQKNTEDIKFPDVLFYNANISDRNIPFVFATEEQHNSQNHSTDNLSSTNGVKYNFRDSKHEDDNNEREDNKGKNNSREFPLEITKAEQYQYGIPQLPNIPESIKNIKSGGRWLFESPSNPAAALIVPLRGRDEQIKLFVSYMHGFLQQQNISYGIYVIEQADKLLFNRGLLFNIGVLTALSDYPYKCLFLHDVDLLPENQNVSYVCPPIPTHMCSSLSSYKYGIPYPKNFGGVVAVPSKYYMACNGMSNLYWGWGGEDDDFRKRVLAKKFSITRKPKSEGRYFHLKHSKNSDTAKNRYELLAQTENLSKEDGIQKMPKHLAKLHRFKYYTLVTANLTSSFPTKQQ